jgi:ATP-dependent helicase HrpA
MRCCDALEKKRADPARDALRLAELKPQDQRYWRLVAECKGAQDACMLEFRWLLEKLVIPQPVSIKRPEKAWGQVNQKIEPVVSQLRKR